MAQDDDFGNLEPGSYDGVVFHVIDVNLLTGSAAAFHKFPNKPGQRVEPTGREPVSGWMRAAMFNKLKFAKPVSTNALWPDGVQLLRDKVQLQKTLPLVIPPYGRLEKAFVRMDETYTGLARNGCFIKLDFWEDNGDAIAKGQIASARSKLDGSASTADNELAVAKLVAQQRMLDAEGNTLPDFKSAVLALQTALNQANESLARPIAQAASIVGAIDDLLARSIALSDPRNWAARNALLDLRDNTKQSVAELRTSSKTIKSIVTAVDTTAAGVAGQVGASVADILALNNLSDPNDIPRDTEILYFAS